MRAAELLRAEILGAVPGDQGSLAKPAKGRPQRRRGEHLLHALETGLQQRRISGIEHVADVIVGRDFLDPEQSLAVRAPLALLQGALERQKRRVLHEKQGRQPFTTSPKSAIAMLPRRPFRGSGKPAHTARNPARRDGKSSIPMVNHFRADLGIPKMHDWATFRIAGTWC